MNHQIHNIPWKSLADCYRLKDELVSKNIKLKKPTLKELDELIDPKKKLYQHFKKCFISTVKEFESTELEKYQEKELKSIKKLFTDSECNNDDGLNPPYYQQYLTEGSPLQDFQYWKDIDWSEVQSNPSGLETEAQVIKILFNRNQMDRIMALIKVHKIPIMKLRFMTYSNFFHYGIGRVFEDAIQIYLYLNLQIAAGIVNKPVVNKRDGTTSSNRIAKYINSLLWHQDYDTQSAIYRPYFHCQDRSQPNDGDLIDIEKGIEVLKIAFRLIYQYSAVATLCGEPINLEEVIDNQFRYLPTNFYELLFDNNGQ
eukprot:gene3807-4737_t